MKAFVIVLVLLVQLPSEKQKLRDELNKADLVVVGKIDHIERTREINLLKFFFDNRYNAKWYWADIDVEISFLPRNFEVLRTRIVFPVSDDPMWDKFPKFEVGDEGVFILNSYRFVKEDMTETRIMMVEREIHFQPKERFEELKKLYINYPPR